MPWNHKKPEAEQILSLVSFPLHWGLFHLPQLQSAAILALRPSVAEFPLLSLVVQECNLTLVLPVQVRQILFVPQSRKKLTQTDIILRLS